jgi:hypothetical protein
MKTKTINIYSFKELSENAKDKARNWWRDCGAGDEWYEYLLEEAKELGVKISGFDTGRGNDISGEFTLSACEVAQNIFNNHGETCDTFKTATSFMAAWQPVFDAYMDEEDEKYESRESENELQELESEFLREILEDYLSMLRKEEEWYFSDEQIDEAITCNEYEFTEDGKIA